VVEIGIASFNVCVKDSVVQNKKIQIASLLSANYKGFYVLSIYFNIISVFFLYVR
jgi:hypothetical protein